MCDHCFDENTFAETLCVYVYDVYVDVMQRSINSNSIYCKVILIAWLIPRIKIQFKPGWENGIQLI